MNKFLSTLTIAATLSCFTHVNANQSFVKLTPYITKQAERWVQESASTLSNELQVAYLNLFAFNSAESMKQFMQCAQFVEANEEMLPSYEALGTSIMNVIKKYVEPIQKKIAAKDNLSKEEEKSIVEKLQIKIKELVAYINTVYYQTLYNYIAGNNPKTLTYMFDAQGIIASEKRTKLLPSSI